MKCRAGAVGVHAATGRKARRAAVDVPAEGEERDAPRLLPGRVERQCLRRPVQVGFRPQRKPGLYDDLKAADAIVDEAERGAAFEEINRQIMEEYLPGLPISHSPPALVVGPGVDGVIPSPLTAEEFDTVTVGGE